MYNLELKGNIGFGAKVIATEEGVSFGLSKGAGGSVKLSVIDVE